MIIPKSIAATFVPMLSVATAQIYVALTNTGEKLQAPFIDVRRFSAASTLSRAAFAANYCARNSSSMTCVIKRPFCGTERTALTCSGHALMSGLDWSHYTRGS